VSPNWILSFVDSLLFPRPRSPPLFPRASLRRLSARPTGRPRLCPYKTQNPAGPLTTCLSWRAPGGTNFCPAAAVAALSGPRSALPSRRFFIQNHFLTSKKDLCSITTTVVLPCATTSCTTSPQLRQRRWKLQGPPRGGASSGSRSVRPPPGGGLLTAPFLRS